ncbi:MAG: rRNA pseudouridine synthase [Gammaproteobacteria bacterium]|nr:rRNA pseudouridine synthase [Gammaproteobacteria bacterium]
MAERLQKVLAAAGHGSRRVIEGWIRAGRLTVGGRVATLGERVEPGAKICLDGRPIDAAAPAQREVLLYNKPAGEVTTRHDPQGRPTVFDRLPDPQAGRWIVIGRLDTNTTGLLVFTTDGALAHRWMHPSSGLEREYLVRVRGTLGREELERLRQGVQLEDGPARFRRIEPQPGSAGHGWYRVVLNEGRNREVRRMFSAIGHEVSRLKRLRYGPLTLPEDLSPGSWRRMGVESDRSV